MRDYSNMPKLEWQDNKGTLARVKNQINHEEPVILLMPQNFNFEVETAACEYDEQSHIYYDCAPGNVLSNLAQLNADAILAEVGSVAENAGMILDVDAEHRQLIIHD